MHDTWRVIGQLALVGAVGGLLSGVLVAALIRLAPRLGLLDRPNERSSHTRVTPRGGGIGVVVVVTLGFVWQAIDPRRAAEESLTVPLVVFGTTALFIALVSLRDDFRSLGAGLRFLCQGAAAIAVVTGVGAMEQFSWPDGEAIQFGILGGALTIVWIVGMTNVYNFMDGIDGLAGIQGFAAGVAWAIAGAVLHSPVVSVLGVLLAGGCLGFLRYNWSPARIFMGDVGSAFLGFAFAVMPLIALRSSTTDSAAQANLPGFAVLAVWPFIGDGFYTFIRRLLRREVVWKPHRTHLYQRLTKLGWSHAQVSAFYAVWCTLSVVAGGCWLTNRAPLAWILGAMAFVWLGVLSWVIGRWERQRDRAASFPSGSVPRYGS